jgi:hypothetical protein
MNNHKQTREKLERILPLKSQKVLMIETLLGTGYVLVNFIRENIEADKLDIDAAYACALICSNLMCLLGGKGDSLDFQPIDLSNEEDVSKKLALAAKNLYDYCQKEGLIDGV